MRPKGVPESAHWIGGADGGIWADCSQLDPNVLKCRVFSELKGDVLLNGTFRSKQRLRVSDLVAFDGNTLLTQYEALSYSAEP